MTINPELTTLKTYAVVVNGSVVGETIDGVEIDFSFRHEIAFLGQTLTGTPTITVLDDDGNVSAAFTVSGATLDATSTKVLFNLTNVVAAPPSTYSALIQVSLSGGSGLVESLTVEVEVPPGGMMTRCR